MILTNFNKEFRPRTTITDASTSEKSVKGNGKKMKACVVSNLIQSSCILYFSLYILTRSTDGFCLREKIVVFESIKNQAVVSQANTHNIYVTVTHLYKMYTSK